MQENQFDTIYHEHFLLLFFVVEGAFARHGLTLFRCGGVVDARWLSEDLCAIPEYGGSFGF